MRTFITVVIVLCMAWTAEAVASDGYLRTGDVITTAFIVLFDLGLAVPVGAVAGWATRRLLTGRANPSRLDCALGVPGSILGMAAVFAAFNSGLLAHLDPLLYAGLAGAAIVVVIANCLRLGRWTKPPHREISAGIPTSGTGPKSLGPGAPAMELGLPENLELFRNDSYVEIVRKWFGGQYVFLTTLAIFGDGILLLWCPIALAFDSLYVILFTLLPLAVGVGLTYYVVAGWLNRTRIHVSGRKMTVRHGPVPWPGNQEFDTSIFKQLYTKKTILRNSRSTFTYETHVLTRDGRDLKLIGDFATPEQALFIEQEIEKYLRIEDIPIKGGIN